MHPLSVVGPRCLAVLVLLAGLTIGLPAAAEPPADPPASAAPAPTSTAPAPPHSGLSPTWFYLGLASATIAGTLTVASGIHTLKVEERFKADGCHEGAKGPRAADCDATSEAGKSAQATTNVLLVTTAVLTVATATMGIFLTRWGNGSSLRATSAAGPGITFAGLELRTP